MRFISLVLLAACAGGEAADVKPPDPAPTAAPAPAEAAPPEAAPAAATVAAAGGGDVANGQKVYESYCTGCHQADGTGMNGMLAGNFVADKTRLQKSDAELLKSIAEGVTGKIGAMPPWGSTLSEQERKDVLAYIRATYGDS